MIRRATGLRVVSIDHECIPITALMRAIKAIPDGSTWRLSYRKCRAGRWVTIERFANDRAARRFCRHYGIAFNKNAEWPAAPQATFIGFDPAVPGTDRTVIYEPAPFDHKSRASGERDD